MRVAYVTADFGVPVFGRKGASVHVRSMVNALCDRDCEVLVLTPQPGPGQWKRSDVSMFEVPFERDWSPLLQQLKQEEICAGNRLAKDIRNLVFSTWMESQVCAPLQRFQPDAIYERYSLFGTTGLRLARRFDIPWILEVNAPLVVEQTQQRGLSLPLVAAHTEREVFSAADHVMVVSDWLKGYVVDQGVPAARASVVPNAADPDLFCPQVAPCGIRDRLGWQDDFVIGFVGSMKDWHGLPGLFEAFRQLGNPFRLLLVGNGPQLDDLRRGVTAWGLEKSVCFAGAVAHDDVPAWIKTMDVAVAPYSKSSGHYFSPVKLFEYMAMARPVVAARLPQNESLIQEGQTGWLYTLGDSDQLARRIRWIAEHPQAAAEVGNAGRRYIVSSHTWAHNAERVVKTLERLCAQPKKSLRKSPMGKAMRTNEPQMKLRTS